MKTRGKNKSTLIIEQAILEIVEERHPITVRGVAYPLFNLYGLIPDMETPATKKVSRIMTAMRESGDLDWRLIVDDARRAQYQAGWSDPTELIRSITAQYRKDYWQDQPKTVEVWSEKGTVQGVIAPVLEKYGVTFRIMKGYGSYTAVRQAAEDSAHAALYGNDFVALYIGDHDPSGLHMTEVDLPARLARYGAEGEVRRVAVTSEDFHLPHFSAKKKKKDPRYPWFAKRYGDNCWELDAINPNDLRDRLEKQICTCISLPEWERAIEVEQAEIESMQGFHEHWQDLMAGGTA